MTDQYILYFKGPIGRDPKFPHDWTETERFNNYIDMCHMAGYRVKEHRIRHEDGFVTISVTGEK